MSSIPQLLSECRHQARLAQVELAQRSGTSQPTLARYESGGLTPKIETLRRLLESAGYELRLTVLPRFRSDCCTASEAGRALGEHLRNGSEEPDWAALDRFRQDFLSCGTPGRQSLLAEPPDPTGHAGLDGLLAGLVEAWCRESDIPTPAWVGDGWRRADPWWEVAYPVGLRIIGQETFRSGRHGVGIRPVASRR